MSDWAVTNSTCLIAFERIGQLSLLPQVFTAVIAPPSVVDEVGVPISFLEARNPANQAAVAALKTQLDTGEADVIALASELQPTVVILDDKKARRIAQQMGLRVVGTLGVLILAKRKGLVPRIEPLLRGLQEAGFHMTESLYEEALTVARESRLT